MKFLVLLAVPVSLAVPAAPEPQPSALAVTLATREGFFSAGTLPGRLHNPGSLAYAHQERATRGDGGYAAFPRDIDGWSALERDIAAKRRRGVSDASIYRHWPEFAN
jgi:hypothetical protein